MPISSGSVKNLKVVNSRGKDVDLLLLKWPPDGEETVLAVPCRVSPGGLVLALPSQALDAETLEGGHEALEDEMVGPNAMVKVPTIGTEEDEELDVVFDIKVRTLLEKKAPRSRRLYLGFAEDPKVMPSMTALDQLVEDWIQAGQVRREDYYTAVEPAVDENMLLTKLDQVMAALGHLESRVDQMQSQPQLREVPRPAPSQKEARHSATAAGSGAKEDPEEILAEVRSGLRHGRPKRVQDEPGRQTAADLMKELQEDPAGLQNTNVDDLMKLSMLKMMQEMSSGRSSRKTKKLPGLRLPYWEDSSDEDQNWSSSSRGGRGIEAVEKLRVAMKNHPEPYQERMEQRMMKSVEATELDASVPAKYIKTIPVGKSRTAGYAIAGFAEILKYLLQNKPKQARLHTLKMLAAFEQFTIDESWVVASRISGSEEPPWGTWANQDLSSPRKQYVYNRLSESTWIAALINELKKEEWLLKKRGGKGPGKGDGKSTDKDKGDKGE